jgi:hypothetical protein
MVVDDRDVECISVTPTKAYAPLIIDPNAVIAGTITTELLQPISRRDPQIVKLFTRVKLDELASRHALHLQRPSPYSNTAEHSLRILVGEGLDHMADVNGGRY